jgi:hypothetical protein
MWAFSLIPDSVMVWIINILLIVGVAGTVAGFFLKIIVIMETKVCRICNIEKNVFEFHK